MSQQSNPPEQPKKNKPAKDDVVRSRIDPQLKKEVEEKAERYGWSLGSVIRALLRLWVEEDVISSDDVGKEAERAPKVPKKKRKSKK